MDTKLLDISLFGACQVRSSTPGLFEITGSKHKALFALLATAPFGRRTRSFLQEALWGVACYDTGRQSLRRALADIKLAMGGSFAELITSSNAEVSLDLSRVNFVGHPKLGLFLEGLDIRETGFVQWATAIRQNPAQLDSLFSLSLRGAQAMLPLVAVLPFRAIGGDMAQSVIGDWLAEEMCRSLSRSRLLGVISHLSCREIAQQGIIDIRHVRERLQPDYCLTGTLRNSGSDLLLDADLIDVRTGRMLWTRQFAARAVTFLESAQDGIASMVVAVGAAIADDAMQHVASRTVADIEDHRLVVAGVQMMSRSSFEDLARSRELLEEAARRAPHAPEVYAWLAKWYTLSVFNGWSVDVAGDTQTGIDNAAHALDLAPQNTLCLSIDGLAQNNLIKNLDLAERRFSDALQINPNEALSLILRGTLHAFRDQGEMAVRDTERARRLSPVDPFSYYYEALCATAYIANDDYVNALTFAESSLRLNHRHTSSLRSKIVALHHLDRGDELRAAGAELLKVHPDFTVEHYLSTHPAGSYGFGRKAAAAFRAAGIP